LCVVGLLLILLSAWLAPVKFTSLRNPTNLRGLQAATDKRRVSKWAFTAGVIALGLGITVVVEADY
jgi:predicted Zn-dependent protease